MPLFLAAVIGVPAFLGAQANYDDQRIVLACSRSDLAKDISEGIARDTRGAYRVEVRAHTTDAEHQRLMDDLQARRIDGFLWIDEQSIHDGRAIYERRSARDFRWQQIV